MYDLTHNFLFTFKGETESVGGARPNMAELAYGANRVEIYRCSKCPGAITRFPRYNHRMHFFNSKINNSNEIVRNQEGKVWRVGQLLWSDL